MLRGFQLRLEPTSEKTGRVTILGQQVIVPDLVAKVRIVIAVVPDILLIFPQQAHTALSTSSELSPPTYPYWLTTSTPNTQKILKTFTKQPLSPNETPLAVLQAKEINANSFLMQHKSMLMSNGRYTAF